VCIFKRDLDYTSFSIFKKDLGAARVQKWKPKDLTRYSIYFCGLRDTKE
jgi:hypothetical protein